MISINKYITLTLVASVLLSAAFVQAEGEQKDADKGNTTGLGAKLFSSIRDAGTKIMSHLPFGGVSVEAPAVKEATQTETAEPATNAEAKPATNAEAEPATNAEAEPQKNQ